MSDSKLRDFVADVRDGVYISNWDDAHKHGHAFDRVITLSRDDGPDERGGSHEHTTDHVPLYDGTNEQEQFDRAVDVTVEAIENDEDEHVLVHCQAGISRSSAVLITALAEIDDEPFEVYYDDVWEARPVIAPHPELRKLALERLGEDGSVYKNPF